MKTVEIKAKDFFEFLKQRNTSMWEVFAQMVDGEEKHIVFLNDDQSPLFNYQLPATLELLKQDQKIFAKKYAEKISQFN